MPYMFSYCFVCVIFADVDYVMPNVAVPRLWILYENRIVVLLKQRPDLVVLLFTDFIAQCMLALL